MAEVGGDVDAEWLEGVPASTISFWSFVQPVDDVVGAVQIFAMLGKVKGGGDVHEMVSVELEAEVVVVVRVGRVWLRGVGLVVGRSIDRHFSLSWVHGTMSESPGKSH